MRQQTHKRGRFTNKTVAIVAALALGGGGAAIIAANASASGDKSSGQDRTLSATAGTISCPDVGQKLNTVPRQARAEVDRNLAELDTQVANAYQRMAKKEAGTDSVLTTLQQQRTATLDRIGIAIGRSSQRPAGLEQMSACKMQTNFAGKGRGNGQGGNQQGGGQQGNQQGGNQQGGQQQGGNQQGGGQQQGGQQQGGNQQGGGQQQGGNQGGNGGQQGNGPSQDDFVDITKVQPNVKEPQNQGGASTGVFESKCGVNEQGIRNTDNVIVAPGVGNGAHHTHDYVGNKTTSANSTNDSLAAGDTTCTNGDQSTYYWPVVRVQDGTQEKDANQLGGGLEGNVGRILTAKSSTLEFKGNPVGKVTAMPRFLRIITGDAKAFTNGTANANAHWSCTGFEDRQLTDKYPLCPAGSDVVRSFAFQSCWDGKNADSANHRDHVAFAQQDGSCPNGFQAIPQLVNKITYEVPAGQTYAVDGFPEQLHKPITDHDDFINVMSDKLMSEAVDCINSGRKCG
ncbi:DUF1996 domain-containing protein [Streptomyces sp. NPDC097640]|uniref:DUF1996 domain-containing protein n=1 Tax=Streptomyces sp. NPDC097640 TaxID=3157229 RepID=UPI00331772A9